VVSVPTLVQEPEVFLQVEKENLELDCSWSRSPDSDSPTIRYKLNSLISRRCPEVPVDASRHAQPCPRPRSRTWLRIRGERKAVGGRDLLPAPALLMAAPRRQRIPDRNAFRARCLLNYSAPVTRDLVHRPVPLRL